jgi:hypothetical protein
VGNLKSPGIRSLSPSSQSNIFDILASISTLAIVAAVMMQN